MAGGGSVGGLEGKPHLQIDSPVRGVAGEESARQGLGPAKVWGTQAADGLSIIDVVEDIARGNAEGQVEPAVGDASSPAKHTSAHAHTAEPTGTKASAAPTSTPASRPTSGIAALNFSAEAEGLTEAQIGDELAEAGPVIGRDDFLPRDR